MCFRILWSCTPDHCVLLLESFTSGISSPDYCGNHDPPHSSSTEMPSRGEERILIFIVSGFDAVGRESGNCQSAGEYSSSLATWPTKTNSEFTSSYYSLRCVQPECQNIDWTRPAKVIYKDISIPDVNNMKSKITDSSP